MEKRDFWQNYRAVALGGGVPQAKVDWFAEWAQKWPDKVNHIRADGAPKELEHASSLKQRGLSQGKTFRDEVTSKEVDAQYE